MEEISIAYIIIYWFYCPFSQTEIFGLEVFICPCPTDCSQRFCWLVVFCPFDKMFGQRYTKNALLEKTRHKSESLPRVLKNKLRIDVWYYKESCHFPPTILTRGFSQLLLTPHVVPHRHCVQRDNRKAQGFDRFWQEKIVLIHGQSLIFYKPADHWLHTLSHNPHTWFHNASLLTRTPILIWFYILFTIKSLMGVYIG